MKSSLLTSAIVGLAFGLAAAETPPSPASAASGRLPILAQGLAGPAQPEPFDFKPETPIIEFATPVFDFGRVQAGEVLRHDFVFTNTGMATLQILQVRPSCGCTTAGQWDKSVEPGKTGHIPIQLNTSGFGGAVAKSVSITCNDPARSNLVLHIRGTIWKPIEITPPSAYFTVLRESSTNPVKVIRIVSNLDEPLKLTDLESTNQSIKAELQTVKEGKEYELRVTAVAPYPDRTIQAQLRIKTSAPTQPLLTIPTMIMVQETLTASPNQLVLPPGPLTNTVQTSVMIRNAGTNAVALSEPEVNIPGAKVQIQETQPGRLFALKVEFPAGYQAKPGEKLEAKVKTDHPSYPVLTVPIVARQRYSSLPVLNPATASVPQPRSVARTNLGPVALPPLPQLSPGSRGTP